ncbi:hypothetical protein [Hyalangium rubrum]|uniref:Lipoprotein n=1 Tax=Hyalangium rubrum TaxID=3103134 RepID=A0ABU5H8M3_9BACT|nr:hypothetical protein [Hyalangium sp. s54d21]MDY7229591.1 hypothetical protein [Hyalangium sp. s54d21]
MASLFSKARLLGLFFPLALVACGEPGSSVPSHPSINPSTDVPFPTLPRATAFSLKRENQGPYLERTVERFRAVSSRSDVRSVLWSASGGTLETQGMEATWTLPRAGTATLTLTAETDAGQQLTETFQYRVSAEASSQSEGAWASGLLAPVAVDTSNDETGSTCDLAFDSAGNGHLIYFNETHPSIWYGFWNGSTWTTQLVDGMGFNTGGIVMEPMALAVDATGRPHIVYMIGGKSVWYATLSGTTWTRERVDAGAYPLYPYGSPVAIALDPSQGNRPTIVYSGDGNSNWRTVVAYRTGANTWNVSPVLFPVPTSGHQFPSGEIAFDPTGKLYIPYGINAFGTWKPATTPVGYELLPSFETTYTSMVRTGSGHLLLRTGRNLLDITPGTTQPVASFSTSNIEATETQVGDLILVGGKPQELHLHGNSLEMVIPNANNYWTYTSLGTASPSTRISLAQRPTTSVVHYCFKSGSKVMFQ